MIDPTILEDAKLSGLPLCDIVPNNIHVTGTSIPLEKLAKFAQLREARTQQSQSARDALEKAAQTITDSGMLGHWHFSAMVRALIEPLSAEQQCEHDWSFDGESSDHSKGYFSCVKCGKKSVSDSISEDALHILKNATKAEIEAVSKFGGLHDILEVMNDLAASASTNEKATVAYAIREPDGTASYLSQYKFNGSEPLVWATQEKKA